MEIGQAVGIDNGTCFTPEDSRAMAVLFEKAGADAVQVRSHVLGWHAAGFLPDALFYPEQPVDVLPEGVQRKPQRGGGEYATRGGREETCSPCPSRSSAGSTPTSAKRS